MTRDPSSGEVHDPPERPEPDEKPDRISQMIAATRRALIGHPPADDDGPEAA